MAAQTVNVLLSSFPGLSLPPTLSISLSASSTIAELSERLSLRLPFSLSAERSPLILTTTNNRQLQPDSAEPLSSLLSGCKDAAQSSTTFLLPLRLGSRLCGGKGGFGSQLRAAGGRMSSRRKGNQEENNGSNRNLDGRRIRTVKEAKALAEYLAIKPDMDKKEKEARRKRWEMVVEAAERKQEELRNGEGKGKVDGAWMEDKEEVNDKTREAVLRAMKDGVWQDNLAALVGGPSSSASDGSGSGSGGDSGAGSGDSEMEDVVETETAVKATPKPPPSRKYFGFDDDEDDDEFMSNEDEDDPEQADVKGKGKAKA